MTCLLSLQDYKDANDIDLVDQGFASLETLYSVDKDTIATFQDKPAKAIWATYRFQLLNCCGCDTYIDRWKYRFTDKAYNLLEKYKILFTAYEQLKNNNSLGVTDSVNTVVTTNSGTTHSESVNNGQTTNERIPQYADASSGQWLNDRVKSDGTNSADGTTHGDGTIVTTSALGMLPAELADKMKNALFNPYQEYAREFADLFIPFFASECDCA